jgi:hypothetical protein
MQECVDDEGGEGVRVLGGFGPVHETSATARSWSYAHWVLFRWDKYICDRSAPLGTAHRRVTDDDVVPIAGTGRQSRALAARDEACCPRRPAVLTGPARMHSR